MKIYTIISTYNPDEKLLEQIESINIFAIKGGVSVNIIIRDDGSSSLESHRILSSIKESNILVYMHKNVGLPGAFFEAMKLVPNDGDYYFFSDQDDVWFPDKVLRVISIITKENKLNALYVSRTQLVDSTLKPTSLSKLLPKSVSYQNSIVTNVATGCTMCLDRNLFELVVSKIPNYERVHMHDWWIYIVASFLGNVIIDNKPTVMYRQHGGNIVGMKGGRISRLKNRINRILMSDSKYSKIGHQINEFKNLYGHRLENEEVTLLDNFLSRNNSFFYRVRFFILPNIKANSYLDLMLIKILILLGVVK